MGTSRHVKRISSYRRNVLRVVKALITCDGILHDEQHVSLLEITQRRTQQRTIEPDNEYLPLWVTRHVALGTRSFQTQTTPFLLDVSTSLPCSVCRRNLSCQDGILTTTLPQVIYAAYCFPLSFAVPRVPLALVGQGAPRVAVVFDSVAGGYLHVKPAIRVCPLHLLDRNTQA